MYLITPSYKKEIGQICVKCGLGKLVLRYGKFGYFLGCSNYPTCKFATRLIENKGLQKANKKKRKWKLPKHDLINIIKENEKIEANVKQPRRKKFYKNKTEQKFNNYFLYKFPELTITKRGYPDFMIIDNHNNCIGFVEVKSNKKKKLRFEQEIFKRFCESNHIPYSLWYPSVIIKKKYA